MKITRKIALEVGFDFVKIVSDSDTFKTSVYGAGLNKFPFCIVKIDSKNMIAPHELKDNFILLSQCGYSYIIGEGAKLHLAHSDSDSIQEIMSAFYSSEKIYSSEFRTILLVAIGLTLVSAGKVTDEVLKIAISLPSKHIETYREKIVDELKGYHKFDLKLGTNLIDYTLSFEIIECDIYCKAPAALMAEIYEDNGSVNREKMDYYVKRGPLLICDSGYSSMELAIINPHGEYHNNLLVSNATFSFKTVNERTSAIISQEYHRDIPFYMIDRIISEGGIKKNINIADIRKSVINELCIEFIEYLILKYYNFDDIEIILFSGEIGEIFFPTISKILEEKKFPKNNIYISSPRLRGKKAPCEFSSTIGMYKRMAIND